MSHQKRFCCYPGIYTDYQLTDETIVVAVKMCAADYLIPDVWQHKQVNEDKKSLSYKILYLIEKPTQTQHFNAVRGERSNRRAGDLNFNNEVTKTESYALNKFLLCSHTKIAFITFKFKAESWNEKVFTESPLCKLLGSAFRTPVQTQEISLIHKE